MVRGHEAGPANEGLDTKQQRIKEIKDSLAEHYRDVADFYEGEGVAAHMSLEDIGNKQGEIKFLEAELKKLQGN